MLTTEKYSCSLFLPEKFALHFLRCMQDGNPDLDYADETSSRFLNHAIRMNSKPNDESAGEKTVAKLLKQRSPPGIVTGLISFRRDDGLFQQGRIVDCTEEGLVIAWECEEGSPTQFIPFGEIYCYKPEEFRDTNAISQGRTSVEVLVRRSPTEPRTWSPGTLRYGIFSSSSSFGLVEVAQPDSVLVVLVPGHRIRRPITEAVLEKLRVRKGQFVKHTVSLLERDPRGKSSIQDAIDAGNGSFRHKSTLFRAARIDDETLDIITIAGNFLSEQLQTDGGVAMHEMMDILLRKPSSRQQRQWKRTIFNAAEDIQPRNTRISSINIAILATEILASAFGYLDSVDQCRLRRVCVYWNHVLTAPAVARVLRVHYQDKVQNYLSAASLHYGWTPQTRIIFNTGVHANRSALFCGGHLFRTLLQQRLHTPVQRLVIADVVFSMELDRGFRKEPSFVGTLGRLVRELNKLAAVWNCLSLRNVKVNLGRGVWPLKSASVRILTGQISGSLTVKELWSRMDSTLPLLDPVQMGEMSAWIGLLDLYGQEQVLYILNEGATCDPRDDVDVGNELWNVNELDLTKISRLTLHRLAAGRKATTMEFSISL